MKWPWVIIIIFEIYLILYKYLNNMKLNFSKRKLNVYITLKIIRKNKKIFWICFLCFLFEFINLSIQDLD
jgi:hypothetical protein